MIISIAICCIWVAEFWFILYAETMLAVSFLAILLAYNDYVSSFMFGPVEFPSPSNNCFSSSPPVLNLQNLSIQTDTNLLWCKPCIIKYMELTCKTKQGLCQIKLQLDAWWLNLLFHMSHENYTCVSRKIVTHKIIVI